MMSRGAKATPGGNSFLRYDICPLLAGRGGEMDSESAASRVPYLEKLNVELANKLSLASLHSADLEARIGQLERQLSECEESKNQEYAICLERIQRAEQEMAILQIENDRQAAVMESYRRRMLELDAAKAELAGGTQHLAQLSTVVHGLVQHVQQLRDRFDVETHEATSALSSFESIVGRLREELIQAVSSSAKVKRESESYRDETERLSSADTLLRSQLSETQSALAAVERVNSENLFELRHVLDQNERESSLLRAELVSLQKQLAEYKYIYDGSKGAGSGTAPPVSDFDRQQTVPLSLSALSALRSIQQELVQALARNSSMLVGLQQKIEQYGVFSRAVRESYRADLATVEEMASRLLDAHHRLVRSVRASLLDIRHIAERNMLCSPDVGDIVVLCHAFASQLPVVPQAPAVVALSNIETAANELLVPSPAVIVSTSGSSSAGPLLSSTTLPSPWSLDNATGRGNAISTAAVFDDHILEARLLEWSHAVEDRFRELRWDCSVSSDTLSFLQGQLDTLYSSARSQIETFAGRMGQLTTMATDLLHRISALDAVRLEDQAEAKRLRSENIQLRAMLACLGDVSDFSKEVDGGGRGGLAAANAMHLLDALDSIQARLRKVEQLRVDDASMLERLSDAVRDVRREADIFHQAALTDLGTVARENDRLLAYSRTTRASNEL